MTAAPARSVGQVRLLGNPDLPVVRALLRRDPVGNVFVASRVESGGVSEFSLGCPMWGWEVEGEVRALLHVGSNLVPVNCGPEAIEAFVEHLGRHRRASSMVGDSAAVLQLWESLAHRWGRQWSQVRDVRASQPVLVIDAEPLVASDPRVRVITSEDLDPYVTASTAMYTEEVGVPPAPGQPAAYRTHVHSLIRAGRAFGIVEDGVVLFKADLGSVCGAVSQVQGVWLHPDLRGHRLAAPAMAAAVRLAREVTPTVSLYVNSYNTRALRTYQRIGMRQVGEFATILY